MYYSYPVDTRRRFNVYKTSIRRRRRRIDVETTSCVHWVFMFISLNRLVVLEEESKRLRNELSEEKARHKFDVDRANKDKEEELEEVHKRYERILTAFVKN